jgi:hypothetical protein
MPDKRKDIILGLITLSLAILVTLTVSEITLTILGLPQTHQLPIKSPQFLKLNRDHPWHELGHVNVANQTATFEYDSNDRGYFRLDNIVTHRFNSLGFRGPDFLEQKSPDIIRIAFFGDSFTMGEGVYFEDTYAQQTRTYFMRNFRKQVESLNFRVAGYNTEQEQKLIGYILPRFNPDVLVLGYTMNDPGNRIPQTQEEAELWDPNWAVRAKYPPPRTRVLRLGHGAWMNWISTKVRFDHSRTLHDPNGVYWPVAESALREIGERCREFNIPCVAVLFPWLLDLQEYPLMREHEQVKETLIEAGFVVLDVLDEVEDFPAAELTVHPTDHHPNELVHRLVGEKLALTIASVL